MIAADVETASTFLMSAENRLVVPTPTVAMAVCAQVLIALTRTPLSPIQNCLVNTKVTFC